MIRMKPDSFRNSTAGLRKSKPAFNLFKSPPQAVLGGYGLFLDVFTSRLRLFVCGRTLLVNRHRLATQLLETRYCALGGEVLFRKHLCGF